MLRRFAVVGTGIVLSFILMIVINGLLPMRTPGWFLARKLFAKGEDTNIALLGYGAIGIDSFLCFVVLVGIYLLLAKHCEPEEK